MGVLALRAAASSGSPASKFPLSTSPNSRYLIGADAAPFLLQGDSAWAIVAQLTNAEIDYYLDIRRSQGFTAILFSAPEPYFTSQTPSYQNVDGQAPFTGTAFQSSLNNGYWSRVDYVVNGLKARGMAGIFTIAYLGYEGGSEGWNSAVQAASAGQLQSYGASVGARYPQGNLIWSFGGDYSGDSTERDKQWNIALGLRSVRPSDIITAHASPGDPAYTSWNGYSGFSLNTAYPDTADVYAECATEYARSPVMPFLMLEAIYEQERSPVINDAGLRRQSYQALFSGACGQFYGDNPVWHFESPRRLYAYTGTWEENLVSNGALQQAILSAFIHAFQWWKLEPKTGTQLVTTSLSSGDTRICPCLASDGSFAMVWKPASGASTVNLASLAPSSVRGRFFNPVDGTYATVSGSPFPNSGTQSISWPGERVLVLDSP